ncbi:MAG: beta-lactamase family protein [Candidatus Thorarchaeota archaeon]|nr:MAG: beta-lactamase family protein [Candidatus Thorarchaeota archaeon]
MKRMLTSICIVVFVFGLLIPPSDSAGTGIVSPHTEEAIERIIIEGNIPSFHTCVVSDEEVIWVRGFGEQTDSDIVFLIGSIQKILVAISILQLHENGSVELDNDVSDYLPFGVSNPSYPDIAITVRMLLAHRSGLDTLLPHEFCYDWEGAYYPDYAYGREYHTPVIDIPLGEFLNECLTPSGSYYGSSNWLYEPGTQYSYSNSGYKILMYLIETVSEQTISEYMQENIFSPLLMNNTGFNSSDFIGHHALPHTRISGSNLELPIWDGQYMMRSTVSDLGHLMIALMNGGQFGDSQILQPETVDMMLERVSDFASENTVPSELRWEGYGLGLDIFSHGLYGHGGSSIGFRGLMYFNPAMMMGYVWLSNVNCILNYDSKDWYEIARNTTEIRNLVLVDVGLFPAFHLDSIPILVIASGLTIALIVIFRVRRR